ncbi:MAG: hypothetical protein DSM106950_06625 [Stigonema ocellatum SAG 48.90 = DSM 106950]|nr:hypothetical protein [Stigonema ocellatum SAG 48.90 = DSM 106950]
MHHRLAWNGETHHLKWVTEQLLCAYGIFWDYDSKCLAMIAEDLGLETVAQRENFLEKAQQLMK